MIGTVLLLSIYLIVSSLNAQGPKNAIFWGTEVIEAQRQNDSLLLGNAFLNLARAEKHRHHIKPAIQAYLQAIPILEKTNEHRKYNRALTELAEIYLEQNFITEAQDYLLRSTHYFSKVGDTSDLQKAHFLLARLYIGKDLLDKAEEQIVLFESLRNDSPNVLNTIRSFFLKGLLKEKKFLYKDAIQDFHNAYQLAKNAQEPQLYTLTLMELGRLHLLIGEAEKAINSLTRAEMVNSLNNNHEQLKQIYNNLSSAYSLKGDYKEAYKYLSIYTDLNDSLLNEKRQEIINKLNIRYEAQQKQLEIINLANEKRIAELKARKDNINIYSLLFGFVGVLVAAFLTILYYQQRLRANVIITEQKEKINSGKLDALKNKIELESMRSMLQGQEMERDRIAKDLHDSLGGMLSTVKLRFDSLKHNQLNGKPNKDADQIHEMLDLAIQEVRNIASNLTPGSLEKLGLVNAIEDLIGKLSSEHSPNIDFQYYGMDHQIGESISVHCYRIIQELLINSLKHSEAEEILVQMTLQGGQLAILVEDDGKGYDINTIKKGMGTDNIISRVHMIKGEIHTETSPGKGTSTLIEIPLDSSNIRVNT